MNTLIKHFHCARQLSLKLILFFIIMFSFVFIPSTQVSAADSAPEYKFGTAYETIRTFDGWVFWVGWDGSFSENYLPQSETYSWVVYFSPDGIFVALQQGKSAYSNVDVYAAIDYFYGAMKSPDGEVLRKGYLNDLLGVTLSINTFDSSMATVGPLSQLSAALSVAQTLYRLGSGSNIQRAIQYGTGMSASFSLIPFSIPAQVSLEYESQVTAGFYPIVLWDTEKYANQTASEKIVSGLKELAANDGTKYIDIYTKVMAKQLIPVMEKMPSVTKIDDFVKGTPGNKVDILIKEAKQWLDSGDTKQLPENLQPPIPPKQMHALLRPVLAGTNSAFEVGYKHGYDSRDRTDTIYANCLVEIDAEVGQVVQIVVTAKEISDLIEGSSPADFEGIAVVFDNSPESYLATQETETWLYIENGEAVFEIQTNTDSPILIGVRVPKDSATGDKTVELCRRLIKFAD